MVDAPAPAGGTRRRGGRGGRSRPRAAGGLARRGVRWAARDSATRDLPASGRARNYSVCVQLASRLQVVDRARRAWPSRCVLSSPTCSDLSVKVSFSPTLLFGTPLLDLISRRLSTVSRYLTSPTLHLRSVSSNLMLNISCFVTESGSSFDDPLLIAGRIVYFWYFSDCVGTWFSTFIT